MLSLMFLGVTYGVFSLTHRDIVCKRARGLTACRISFRPPVLSLSCALPLLPFARVMPLCSQDRHEFYQSFFIDTIVHISVLNDNLPSKRSVIFQRFGVHPTPKGFIQWGASFVTFESKS
jgi:hypothetical protein